jgi:ADP-ribosylglycohydrolase
LAAYYFANNIGKKPDLLAYICEQTNEFFINEKTDRTECDAIDTIDAVLTVLSQANTLSEVLYHSVKLGGDTDSVASIACGIAALSDEYANDLPEFLLNNLENDQYGKDYLIKLDKNLLMLSLHSTL